MKIVCDACQAKYSISDDKVQGKVFKIRCKKCSNIIVVRGGAGAAEAPPAQEKDTRVYDYGADAGGGGGGDEAVWHVVINQDQVGPMTAAEVQQRFAAGEIDGETYAWREGFADWLPLSQVDAFASYVASGSTTAAVSNGGGGGAAAVSAMFGGGEEAGTVRSDPGDLFSAASASASSRGGDDDGDLFGSKPSSNTAAQNAANAKLRGERNENSVLFSLNNLAQLASDKPAMSASAGSTSSVPSGHATSAAGGEGSGLIDIRSMANAYLGNTGGSAGAARPAASIGSIDDLPVFGGGGFSEPAVIVPTAGRQNNNKMMYVLIASVGFLAIAAVIMVVVLLKGGKGDNNQVASNDKPDTTAKGGGTDEGKTPETKTPDTATPDKGSDGSAATPDTAAKTPDNTETKTPETKTPETKTPETKTPETKKPETKKPETKKPETKKPQLASNQTTKTETKKPEPPVKEPAGGGGCDEVSCVLNNYEGACCAKFKKGGGAKPSTGGGGAKPSTGGGGGDLPESLDRGMITDGVNKVKARVMACGDKSSAKGQVKVSVKVSPAGSVSGVTVKATPDPALGNCVAGAMQKASFGKTQNGGSFAYPWNF